MKHQIELTTAEMEHIGALLNDNYLSGSYYGNKKHWQARGAKLLSQFLYALHEMDQTKAAEKRKQAKTA